METAGSSSEQFSRILGIGTDLVEIERIRAALDRHGQRFFERILRDTEFAYCKKQSDPSPHLAARFAAKEAISKAFGTGIGEELGWMDLEICRDSSGRPWVQLHGKAVDLMTRRGGRSIHLSLTHARDHAMAFAILEG